MSKVHLQADCSTCSVRHKSAFQELSNDELSILNENKGCGFYKKGSTIFMQGHYPNGLFCLKNGKIKIYKTGDEGKEQIVRFGKSGDILGYRALLSGDSYSCSADVLEDSHVCFVPRSAFMNLLTNSASLSLQMMKLLGLDLRQAENRITELAQKPVRERVAEALLLLKETYGVEVGSSTINVSLSREEIANLVGTATETTIRLLSEFKQDGLIELQGKKISITNFNKLVQVANLID
jgi:CRP/FNR family transcriptional regulator